jgi:hypothetical protein
VATFDDPIFIAEFLFPPNKEIHLEKASLPRSLRRQLLVASHHKLFYVHRNGDLM